jgi:acyl carrier protein
MRRNDTMNRTDPPPPDPVRTVPAGSPGLLQAVREEVARVLGERSEDLTPGLRLGDDLDIDSLMLIEMKCGLERRFPELTDVPLADVFLGCGTIGDLADRVADLVGLPAR